MTNNVGYAIVGVLIAILVGLYVYQISEYSACRDRGGTPVREMYGPGVECMETKR